MGKDAVTGATFVLCNWHFIMIFYGYERKAFPFLKELRFQIKWDIDLHMPGQVRDTLKDYL